MTRPTYVDCPCGKRIQADATGKARPHAVPINHRKDPKRAERCPPYRPGEPNP